MNDEITISLQTARIVHSMLLAAPICQALLELDGKLAATAQPPPVRYEEGDE